MTKIADLLEFMPKGMWLILAGVVALFCTYKGGGATRVIVFLLIGISSVGLGIALLVSP